MTDTVLHYEQEPCTACGRNYKCFSELGGRSEDFLFSPERGWIPPAIVTYPLKNLHLIQDLQITQKEPTTITVKFVQQDTDLEGLAIEIERIKSGFQSILGTEMNIQFQGVEDIPRGPTGKFKWIVNELDEFHAKFGGDFSSVRKS